MSISRRENISTAQRIRRRISKPHSLLWWQKQIKATASPCMILGRYLPGLGCEKDEEQAQDWFAKAYYAFVAEESKVKKKDYLQYRIGKLFSFGYGVGQDYLKAAEWYEKAVEENNPFAAYPVRR